MTENERRLSFSGGADAARGRDARTARHHRGMRRRITPPAPAVPEVDAAILRRIAVDADADPRTIARELAAPGAVKGMCGHRIRRALRAAGLIP